MYQLYRFITISIFILQHSYSQTGNILGKIMSNEGEPLPYVNVGLSGTTLGTITDSSGLYSIKNIPKGNYLLKASSIGFNNFEKQITINGKENILLNITLTPTISTLNEIVVTGVSRATLIRENPISIISISPKTIDQTNESNIIDVLVKNAPGLNAVKTGPNISKPFIRGLGYNRVLTLYDGIRQEGQPWGDEHGIEVDAYNIDKAEVIKGPASLMYGSDALAGVVSLFPFIPNNTDRKLHGKFTSEYQTNNNLIGNGLRLDYSNEHFLFAVRGSYRIAKNYRNAIDGRVYNTNFDEKNLSALIGYKSDKGFSHFNVTLYDNLQGIPDGSRDSLTRKFTKQIYEGSNDDIKNRPVVSDAELNSYQLSPLHQHIQHYRIYTHNFYQIGNGDMNFLFALQQNIRREYNHPTMPEQAGMYMRLNTINYGWRYNAPKFANIETSIGINGMLQNNKNINATDFPIPDYNLYDFGMYVYAKWKYKKCSVSGGIRYDLRQVQWNDFYVKTNTATGFNEHTIDTNHAVLQFSAYKKTFQGISASLGWTFQATKQINIKANVGRGYRAPNITEMGSNGLDPGAHIIYLGNRNFNPEFSLQEDIGVSAVFKDISADISIFNNYIQNFIYMAMLVDANGNPVMDAQGNKAYQYQQASAQLYGAEAGLSIHPKKWNNFSFDNSIALVYGFNRNPIYKGKGVMGEYLAFIPPFKYLGSISKKISINMQYLISVLPKIELEYSAAQNRYLKMNDTETPTPAYALFNIGILFEIKWFKVQRIQFQFQINNVFNTVYQSHLSRLKYFEYHKPSPNGHLGIYNMGRNICFKLILRI